MESKNKGIDERTIKCNCDSNNCAEGGISFDGTWLRFHYLEQMEGVGNLTQRTKSMHLNRENTIELIETLQEILETEFKQLQPEEESKSENPKEGYLVEFETIFYGKTSSLYKGKTEEEVIEMIKRIPQYKHGTEIKILREALRSDFEIQEKSNKPFKPFLLYYKSPPSFPYDDIISPSEGHELVYARTEKEAKQKLQWKYSNPAYTLAIINKTIE